MKKKQYTEEFKRDAVKQVQQGASKTEVAKDLGVSWRSIATWVTTYQKSPPPKPKEQSADDLDEVDRLKRALRYLKAECLQLRRTIGFLASEGESDV